MVLLTLTLVMDPYAGVNTEVCTERGEVQGKAGRGTELTSCRGQAYYQLEGTEETQAEGKPGLWEYLCLSIHTDPHASHAQIWIH